MLFPCTRLVTSETRVGAGVELDLKSVIVMRESTPCVISRSIHSRASSWEVPV